MANIREYHPESLLQNELPDSDVARFTTHEKKALAQSFKNIITPPTSKLKSVPKYQFLKILYFTLKQVKHNSLRRAVLYSRIRS